MFSWVYIFHSLNEEGRPLYFLHSLKEKLTKQIKGTHHPLYVESIE